MQTTTQIPPFDPCKAPPAGMNAEQWREATRSPAPPATLAEMAELIAAGHHDLAAKRLGDRYSLDRSDPIVSPAFAAYVAARLPRSAHAVQFRGDWWPPVVTRTVPRDIGEAGDRAVYQLCDRIMWEDMAGAVNVLRRWGCSVSRVQFPDLVAHLLTLGRNAVATTPDGGRAWLTL